MARRIFATAALALMALAAPAAAQQYPPAVNSFTVSDTTPTPGQTITGEARTFAPGATVTITLESLQMVIATGQANGAGVVSVPITIPADHPVNDTDTLFASGQAPDGTTLTLMANITVVAAEGGGEGAPSGVLPRTGDDTSVPLAKIGLALAALGGIITAAAAKRRKAAAVAA